MTVLLGQIQYQRNAVATTNGVFELGPGEHGRGAPADRISSQQGRGDEDTAAQKC